MIKTNVTAIVLAAGSSSRMEGDNKLTRCIDDDPLLLRSIKQVLASNVQKCIVVLSELNDDLTQMLTGINVEIVTCRNAEAGMSASMRSGILAAGEDTSAYMICLADMPDLKIEHFNLVIDAYDPENNRLIIRPKTISDQFGHPVLFDSSYYSDLLSLDGDIGAKAVIKDHSGRVYELEMDDAVITDLDTPQAWMNWQAQRRK
tara:strand:+ start:331 stop:939 length:609 start_codon:yes stop_codon:yes gene_type:complete